jgi:hypothetical protein
MSPAPVLTDRRVDDMRSAVMLAVDEDVRRRGRRVRRTFAAGVAAAVVVVAAPFGVSLMTTSTQSSDESGSDMASSSSGEAALDAPSRGTDDAGGKAADAERQVITTGTVSVTVDSPRDTAQRLSTWVDGAGGRVDSRSESGDGDEARADLVVRVPSDKVTATIDELDELGEVDDVSLQNDDVTGRTQDLDARIEALQVSADRLTAIMADAETSEQLIAAEAALTQRQEQLEALVAERKGLADQVSLSTLTIDLSQASSPSAVSSGGFRGGLVDGWNALADVVEATVRVVGVLLPWAAVVALLALAYRLVRRVRRS